LQERKRVGYEGYEGRNECYEGGKDTKEKRIRRKEGYEGRKATKKGRKEGNSEMEK
jgi:hypothetical protein